jgi:hypothetical protein
MGNSGSARFTVQTNESETVSSLERCPVQIYGSRVTVVPVIPYFLRYLSSTFYPNKSRIYSYWGWYKYTHKWNYSKGSEGVLL